MVFSAESRALMLGGVMWRVCALAMMGAAGACLPGYAAEGAPGGTAVTVSEDVAGAVTVSHRAMGTVFVFTVYARGGNGSVDAVGRIAGEAFEVVDDLERRISSWLPESQTTYLNRHGAEGPVRVSGDLFELLACAKAVYVDTGGAFDVTVGPLLEVWGFRGGGEAGPPGAAALALVGMDKVLLDVEGQRVSFAREGMRIDLGGIGKGLALDRAAGVLKRYGVESALLHAGTSTVLAIGAPPGEAGWRVHIRHPLREGDTMDTVLLRDESLSTSGCYGAAAEAPCDVLDPRTGGPVKGMLSATAIGRSGMLTDALSTAFLVMGPAETRRYCDGAREVRAILATTRGGGAPERINFVSED